MTKFYITTTIPYVNAAPHIGHALEFVQADVIARWRRQQGDDVYFLSGSDENAIKNVQAAEAAGISVQELVDKNSQRFRESLVKLNVSFDQFIRTTEERHKKGAQALWEATDKQYIYKKKYHGFYCVGCELFYEKDELDAKGECFEHPGKQLEVVEEENYFFKLSAFQDWLKELIGKDHLHIVPETRKKETLSFIERGLEDFSISRPVERSKGWGVLVPDDESQTMYVWYDALANYITALGYPDQNAELYKNFWQNSDTRLHVLGKGVGRFHTIYWPAMLKAAGLPLPGKEFIHGYITVDGQKMSKSIGNVIDPFGLVEKYGVDAVRYFFLREIPPTEDGDFSFEKFETRYNADLASGLGNLVARTLALASKQSIKYQVSSIKQVSNPKLQTLIDETKQKVDEALAEFRFNDALAAIWDIIHACDKYVDEKRPWQATEGQKAVIADLLLAISHIAELIQPFLPETAQKIQQQLQGGEAKALFPRLESRKIDT